MKINSKTTKQQLIAYAATTLGAQLSDDMSRDDLVAEVLKLEKSLGMVSETDKKEETTTDNPAENVKTRPRFAMLRIHTPNNNNDEDSDAETHCIVGFNGRNYQIQYDVEDGVKVPYGVYDVIKNAIQVKHRKVKGQRELVQRKEQRYKFNVVKFID